MKTAKKSETPAAQTVGQSETPAATLRKITAAGNQILDRIEAKLHPESDDKRFRRCWCECKDSITRIGETGSADLMDQASAALWDLLLEHRLQIRRQSGR